MPKVSIIIPTYNSEKYLTECLDSVINQSLTDIEIIIVDANSKDSTLQIIEKYTQKDNRITLINRPYEYVGLARNVGLDNASSKYCMFLDSDDTLDTKACEITYNIIKNSNVDFVMFGNYEFNEKGIKTQNLIIKSIAEEKGIGIFDFKDLKEFIGIDSVEPWKKTYKLDFLNKYNIRFGNESFGEDVPFYWKVLTKFNKCFVCDDYLYSYRKTTNNVGTGTISTRYNTNFEVFNISRKILENSDRHDEYISYFLIALINNYAYWLNKINKNDQYIYYKRMQYEFKEIANKYNMNNLLKNNTRVLNYFIGCMKNNYLQFPNSENKIFYFAKYANILKINVMGIKLCIRSNLNG